MEVPKAKSLKPVVESSNIQSLWREGLDYAAKRHETSIDEKKDDSTSAIQRIISFLSSLVFRRSGRGRRRRRDG